ncbi:MAG: GntR family transcriptional regulator [Nitrobacter sp. 62-13]|uniref:aminotransferase-like domain-containing protein n=1 Tax=Nitrobacter sp. 62-13 TaxID=1895797 RepID=UPI00095C91CD|nr:PLP-dependent aminotransferase family protein [Nitrobacter sp. 62-13]OJU26268.1 MAG: GntR family transcriptional regulator [Nitrobacter sp. 62-13]
MPVWKPIVPSGEAPLYERIADAIEQDIRDGALPSGTRLPPHRDLAHALSVSIGTVTKAYGEAERRGLLVGHVGRGSFVAGRSHGAAASNGPVDLALNLPAGGPGPRHFAEALARLRRRSDLALAAEYAPPEGLESVRRIGGQWLQSRHGVAIDPAEIIQTNGGQHALALAFGAIARPGETILCEAATFYGVKTLAEVVPYRLHGVDLDAGGLKPAALEKAIAETGARVVYTIPTLQNPTTITMTAARRKQIAAIARKRDLLIVEDEAYRAIAAPEDRPPTFTELAPDRTIHVATISKAFSPGLRLGFLRAPTSAIREQILHHVRAIGYAPPALGALVFSQWIEDGTADLIADQIVQDALARSDVARRILGSAMTPPGSQQSIHVWIPMSALDAERAAGRALRAGVELTPPDAPIVAPDKISGLRVCLGGAPDLVALEAALTVVAQALQSDVGHQTRALV